MSSIISDYVSRVTQLDAITLDSELEKLLKGQLNGILVKIRGNRWTQEAELFLSFLIWKFSVFDKNSTVGQRLLGLEYPSVGKKRLVYIFVLDKLLPYIQQKITKFTASSYQFFWNLVENCVKACQLLNLLTFLLQNRYPSLSLRVAGMSMKSVTGKGSNSFGYSYQIRELLWHQFADILMVILPLINTHAVKTYFTKRVSTSHTTSHAPVNGANSNIPSSITPKCCYCKEDPTIPTKLGNCTFCYFCLKANQKSDPNFTCTH